MATDANQRTSSCTFTATVQVAPVLSVTRFLAFGDSITQGVVPDSTDSGTGRIKLQIIQPSLAYPTQLKTMLTQRYFGQAQNIVVTNAGLQGDKAVDGANRLPGVLNNTVPAPEVLLLLEGVNDLCQETTPGSPAGCGLSSISAPIDALRSMIRLARGRGMRVMVGTLLPQIPGLPRANAPGLIVPFNNQLVPMAVSEGAIVVDLHAGISVDVASWISPLDGLHPTAAGYQEMARLFLSAIQANYELTSGSLAAPGGRAPILTLGTATGRMRR